MQATASHSDPLEAERSPLGEMLALAGPTVAQMASYTVMQFIDAWMLSRLGRDEPTAASNSGMFAFTVISFGMGVMWIVNALVSQHYGQKDYARCGRYLWQGVWWSLAYSVLLLPTLPLVPMLFRAFGHEPHLLALQSTYFQIVVSASVFKLVGTAIGQFLLAIDRARWVLLSAVVGVSANAVAAWAMIFGHLGCAKMGLAGAAWAQNVGATVEMLVLACFAFTPAIRRRFLSLDWRFRWSEFKTLTRVGVPSGAQVVADVSAWSFFLAMVLAPFGSVAMAANTFMFRYMVVSFMPALGMSAAVTAVVGRYIGRGDPDTAMRRADLAFKVTAIYVLVCGAVFVLARRPLIGVFSTDPEVIRVGAVLMVYCAAYLLFDAMYIIYNGALRGAGDTFVPAVATATLNWGITVLGGFTIVRLAPGLGIHGPWSVALFYGIVLGVFLLRRFRAGRWRSISMEGDHSPQGAGSKAPEPFATLPAPDPR